MTYKATVIFGEKAVSEYQDTRTIPKHLDDGVINTIEFKTKAEYDAYCKALNDAPDYYG